MVKNLLIYIFCYFLLAPFSYSQNFQLIDSLMLEIERTGSDLERVDYYVQIANEYCESDSIKTSQYASLAIKLSNEIGHKKGVVDAMIPLAWSLQVNGHFQKAEEQYAEIIALAESADYATGLGQALQDLGVVTDMQGKYEEALILYNRSVQVFQEANNQEGIADCYSNIAFVYRAMGDFSNSLKFYSEALKIFESMGSESSKARMLNNIGTIYVKQGDYEQALQSFLTSLSIFTSLDDERHIAMNNGNIGVIYKKQGKYDKALDHYLASLEIFKGLGDRSSHSNMLNNIGVIYKVKGDYSKALEFYDQSLSLSKELGDKNGTAFLFKNIGNIYLEMEEYESAFKYGLDALQLSKEIGARAAEAESMILLGTCHKNLRNWKKGREYLQKALDISGELGMLANARNAAFELSLLERDAKNYKLAFEAHVLYNQLADSLQNKQQIQKITRLETEYEFQQERDSIRFASETQQMAFEKDIENRKLVQRNTLIGLVVAGVLLIFVFILYRNNKQKTVRLTSLNSKIQAQSVELTTQRDDLQETLHKLKETRSKLIKSEKMATSVTLAAGVAHEINNPLNFISSSLEAIKMLSDEFNEEQREKLKVFLEMSREGVVRTSRMVDVLRDFSSEQQEFNAKCDLGIVFSNCIEILRPQLIQMHVENGVNLEKHFTIGNLASLHQSVTIIFNHIISRISHKSNIRVEVESESDHFEIIICFGDKLNDYNKEKFHNYLLDETEHDEFSSLDISASILEDNGGSLFIAGDHSEPVGFMLRFRTVQER